jgi:hypothetical protein
MATARCSGCAFAGIRGSKAVRRAPSVAMSTLPALLLLALLMLGGCGLGGATDVSGTWHVTQSNPDGTVFTHTMTLQQNGTNLTGTWSAGSNVLALTGTINGQHVELTDYHTGPGGTCNGVLSFLLTDSTHMQGTSTESGVCGNDFLAVNDSAVKQ